MRATLGGRNIVGFDLKWNVVYQQHGMGNGNKVAVMQICYIIPVLLFLIRDLTSLPPQLESIEDKINQRVAVNAINLGKCST